MHVFFAPDERPFILDSQMRWSAEVNAFLARLSVISGSTNSPKTWRSYAYEFADWLGFCERIGMDWRRVTELDIAKYRSILASESSIQTGRVPRAADMKRSQRLAISVLAVLFAATMLSGVVEANSHARQHRDLPGARPSAAFPLGTDELGRDRLARLLFATRISLVLAPAASLAATLLAAAVGGIAGYFGGLWDRCAVRVIDLMLSLPWLLLLLAARALLPLDTPPVASLIMTYGLLAILGWAGPARVIRAGTRKLRESDFTLQASAEGCGKLRILWRHVIPNLKPLLLAQLWTTIPVFILAEANLGLLGLSASEPFPTWGNLLRDLQTPFSLRPEAFAPLAVVMLSVACFKLAMPTQERHT